MRGRRGVRCSAATLLVLTALALAPTTATGAVRPADPRVHGIRLVGDEVLPGDGRLHSLTLLSDVLGRAIKVRVLLPASYDDPAAASTRYPVLLLLHGANSTEQSWTESTDVEGQTAPLDLMVVMPEGGTNGFYTDWLDGPQWETFHLRELLPWVDATYRTVGTRAGRAVAGLSMGGFGSTSYAARNQDVFTAVASFSGGVDLADAGIVEAEALRALGLVDDRPFGPYLTHEANWRGHNPPDLAPNLRGIPIRLTTGTGVPCAGDRGPDVTEAGVHLMMVGFTLALERLAIPYELVYRACGTHEWHYWEADLAAWLPTLMSVFASPPAPPSPFDDRFTEPHEDVWGWSFTAHRPAIEFVDLRGVSPAGLTATGSGLLDVVTPPVYEPGATYAIASTSAGVVSVPIAVLPTLATLPSAGAPTASAVADGDGRLRFTLDLGPAHTANQYSPDGIAAEALGAGSYFRTVTASISRSATAPPAPSTTAGPAAGGPRELPATGAAAPSWALVASALLAAEALRRLAYSVE